MPNFLIDMVLNNKADKLKFNNIFGGGHVIHYSYFWTEWKKKKTLHIGYFSFVLNWPLFKKHCSPQWPTGQEFADQLESSLRFQGTV